jgi:chlorobactene glucosyltransferase
MLLFGLIMLNSVLVLLLGSLTIVFFAYFLRIKPDELSKENLPFVTVLVPARNEERSIRRCLESLVAQDYPNFEIVVINDRSTDKTGDFIAELTAKYPIIKAVESDDAPPGWIGKCNALVRGVREARGDWYVFTDADTCHKKESLKYAVGFALNKGSDMVSFMPVQELKSFWERLIMPVLLGSFLVGDPLNTINDPEDERAYAYGQYILVKRAVYEAIGGHESVHDQILDDIVIARVAKGKGYQVNAASGMLLYKVRMYTDFESVWHGWTKNAYALIECRPSYLALILSLINAGILFPFIHALIVGGLFLAGTNTLSFHIMIGCVVVEMAMLMHWFRQTGRYYEGIKWYHFFLLPFGSIAVTALYLRSAQLVHTRQSVQWKGRSYVVDSTKSVVPPSAVAALCEESSSVSPVS